jgi:hypothetical protein
MRIIDKDNNRVINSVILLLTPDELKELYDSLLSIKPVNADHVHINDIDYEREVTVSVYTKESIKDYPPDIQALFNDNL